tara:strand:+ start:860 stop:1165 length:306 start_codon:yes stop_codon:yes gene_type:complete
MINLIERIDLKINSKKNYLTFFYSFLIGTSIPFIPLIFNIFEEVRFKNTIKIENKILRENIKDKCKDENSRYRKLKNLGFNKFALEEFNTCFRENLKNEKK